MKEAVKVAVDVGVKATTVMAELEMKSPFVWGTKTFPWLIRSVPPGTPEPNRALKLKV